MSTVAMPEPGLRNAASNDPLEFSYRPMSLLAVVVFALGLLSDVFFRVWFILPLPALAVLIGIGTLLRISRSQGQIGGFKLTLAGISLASSALLGGMVYQWNLYRTEMPKGYLRVSFTRDISERGKKTHNGSNEIDPSLLALDGQKIFIKGFMYPVEQQRGLTSFLLVKDSGTCCFGGKPKLTDMIGVYMNGDATTNYHTGRVSVAGTFHLNHHYSGAEQEPIFLMDGMQVTRSQSDFDPLQEAQLTPQVASPPETQDAPASEAAPQV